LRPLRPEDARAFHEFWLAVPEDDRMFIKQRVTDWEVINTWCQNIDLHRNLPILAWAGKRVVGDATLHQHLGGWKRHIGHVSALVRPEFRGRSLGKALLQEVIRLANHAGLERVEAEFVGDQHRAMKLFGLLGFRSLFQLQDYVRDMKGDLHDYVVMAADLRTAEEYAGVG
jgi:RimJ/RimL family protein N-acetyltransferase